MSKFVKGDVRNGAPASYFVKIRIESSSSCVPVSMTPNVDQALGIALNLHQLSSMKHHITVEDPDGIVVATLVRTNSSEFKGPALSK